MYRLTLLVAIFFSALGYANPDPTKPFGAISQAGAEATDKNKDLVLDSIIHGEGIHTVVINGKLLECNA